MAQDGSGSRANGNGDALRELAARLLMIRDVEDERGAALPRIFVGRLPEDLPSEVPIPDEAEVVGGVTRHLSRSRRNAEVVLDVALPAERFREVYLRQLLAAGWDEDEWVGRRGFVPPGPLGLFHRAAFHS